MGRALIFVVMVVACGCMPSTPREKDWMAATPTAPAQPSLTGLVTDAVSGARVVGATVTVQGKSVTTSSTGHYGFDPNLAAGTFPVKVTHPQYVDSERDVQIAPYKWADFALQPR